MAYDYYVQTPNGFGWAFGLLPDGKVLVCHGWSQLTDDFKENYEGHKASTVILEYEMEDISEQPFRERKRR